MDYFPTQHYMMVCASWRARNSVSFLLIFMLQRVSLWCCMQQYLALPTQEKETSQGTLDPQATLNSIFAFLECYATMISSYRRFRTNTNGLTEDRTDRLSRNVGDYHSTVTCQGKEDLIYIAAQATNHVTLKSWWPQGKGKYANSWRPPKKTVVRATLNPPKT